MRLVTITSFLAVFGFLNVPMLMDSALAVEVPQGVGGTQNAVGTTEASDPRLPEPATQPQSNSGVENPGRGPSEGCFILGSTSFSIPFTVDAVGIQPASVRLFVSRGPGETWELFDQKKPTAKLKQFQYKADGDGEYWFATRTMDASGQAHPAGAISPQLKVYVDTTKPVIDLDVNADDQGRVHAALSVKDATPLKIVQLRYASDTVKTWQNLESAQLAAGGEIQFAPDEDWKLLSLQLVVSDTPGNQTVINQMIRRPRVATSHSNRFAANQGSDPLAARALPYRLDGEQRVTAEPVSGPGAPLLAPLPRGTTPSINPPPSSTGWTHTAPFTGLPQAAASTGPAMAQRPHGTHQRGLPQYGTAPQYATGRPSGASRFAPNANYRGTTPSVAGSPTASQPTRMEFAPPSVRETSPVAAAPQRTQAVLPPPATPMQIGEGFGLNSPQRPSQLPAFEKESPSKPRTMAEAMRPITEESAVAKIEQEEIPTPNAQPDPEHYRTDRAATEASSPDLQRAPVRFSDSERFSLEYELEAVGSQGVEAIELYGSLDQGSTWSLWGQDPDRSSPFDIETQGEGVFGFRIVVVGGNGLASPRPLAGESPDIFVVVDRTRPSVRISGARYGEGDQTGGLVIRYECNDNHLTRRPIGLAFSGSSEGPWTTIAAGLQNTGNYVWRADPNLPRQLYLRIDATDEAGNVGSYILDQPIDTQGLAPRARIRGFQPLSDGSATDGSATDGGQTASRAENSLK